ncbi:hypothetical protein [Pseudoroseicyclus sp. CXY001]|uniref:hypothetical protein n=1 Tax=Pseudoroseicyclus sp. CXY001 TaxID=3242492 RepID=UPI00357125AE
MKTTPRWISARIRDAAACRHRMPWERGLRRAAMIARRQAGFAAAGGAHLTARPATVAIPVAIHVALADGPGPRRAGRG